MKMSERKIFSRRFKIKNFSSQKLNQHQRRSEIIEFSNLFRFVPVGQEAAAAAIPKYHLELFVLKDGEEHSRKYLFISFYLTCPPAILKNYQNYMLKISILDAHFLKCCTKGSTIQLGIQLWINRFKL